MQNQPECIYCGGAIGITCFDPQGHANQAQYGPDETAMNDVKTGERWRKDSSMETWFPMSAELIKDQQEKIKELLMSKECLIDFMRAVAREVDCLPSFADPRPNGGNSHIIKAIQNLKK